MAKRLRNIFDHYQQKENHLTHSLLHVLNENRNLLKTVLKTYGIRLTSKQINLITQVAPRTVEDRSSIPDGYIYTEDYNICIGIETKINQNALNRDQILGHLEQLSEYNTSYLIVLTPDEKEPEIISELVKKHRNLKFVSWIDLLKLMSEVGPDKGSKPIGQYLFDEFFNYIERCYHMTPFTGFNFRDGYDRELAQHYVKRVSKELTPDIKEIYPNCTEERPRVQGVWWAWYSSKEVQKSVHPAFAVRNDRVRCNIVLANGCKKEWKQFQETLMDAKSLDGFKRILNKVYTKRSIKSRAIISFRQRHYPHITKSVLDAEVEINIATLLGMDKSKPNEIWWSLIKDVADSKSRYNYQLEIGYHMNYEEVEGLKSTKAIQLMLKCFRYLKPVYNALVVS